MTDISKNDDGGANGMMMVSAIDNAEENTSGDLRKKDKVDNKSEIEKSQRQKIELINWFKL